MSLEPMRTYVIRRVSLASRVQPFLVGKQREVGGRFLQDILPDRSPAEREFILSGTMPSEWRWKPAGAKLSGRFRLPPRNFSDELTINDTEGLTEQKD